MTEAFAHKTIVCEGLDLSDCDAPAPEDNFVNSLVVLRGFQQSGTIYLQLIELSSSVLDFEVVRVLEEAFPDAVEARKVC